MLAWRTSQDLGCPQGCCTLGRGPIYRGAPHQQATSLYHGRPGSGSEIKVIAMALQQSQASEQSSLVCLQARLLLVCDLDEGEGANDLVKPPVNEPASMVHSLVPCLILVMLVT